MTGTVWLDGVIDLAFYVLAYAASVVAHEGGHLLAALLLGLGPRAVYIGKGPLVARRRVGRVWVILHAVPVTGLVVAPAWFGRPLARFVFVAAGPATNLALLGLGLLGLSADTPLVSEPALALVVPNLSLLVTTLVPHRFKTRGREVPSDGLQLALMLTGKRVDTLTELHATLLKPLLAPGERLPEPSRHFPEIAFQVGRPERLREGWAVRDVQDGMRGLLAAPDLPRAERTFVLTFLVGNELAFGGTGAGLADLDAWSAEGDARRRPGPGRQVLRPGVSGSGRGGAGRGGGGLATVRRGAGAAGGAGRGLPADPRPVGGGLAEAARGPGFRRAANRAARLIESGRLTRGAEWPCGPPRRRWTPSRPRPLPVAVIAHGPSRPAPGLPRRSHACDAPARMR